MALDIGEIRVGISIGITVAAGNHCSDLRTGDGIVRTEVAVRTAVDDAEFCHGGHSRIVPCLGRNIFEGVVAGGIGSARCVRQEAVEDGGRLGTGDGRVGLERAVRIALDIGIVVFAVEHVWNSARGLRPHGGEGVGTAGLCQIPAVEGIAGTSRIGKRIVLVNLERLLIYERHVVQPGRAAVRVDHDGGVNVETGVLALSVVIVIIEDIICLRRALLCPHSGERVGIAGLCQIPAVERIANACRIGERVIPVNPERLLARERCFVQTGSAAVRVNYEKGIGIEAGILTLSVVIVIIEDAIRLRLAALRPHSGEDRLTAAVIGLIPAIECVAGTDGVIERHIFCHAQHSLSIHIGRIQIGRAAVRVDGNGAAVGKRLIHNARIVKVRICDLDAGNCPSGREPGTRSVIIPADRLLRALVGERQRAGTRDLVAAGNGDSDAIQIGLGAAVQIDVNRIACVDRDLPCLLVTRIVVGDLTGRNGIVVNRIQNQI